MFDLSRYGDALPRSNGEIDAGQHRHLRLRHAGVPILDVDGTVEVGGFVEYTYRPFTLKVELRQGINLPSIARSSSS